MGDGPMLHRELGYVIWGAVPASTVSKLEIESGADSIVDLYRLDWSANKTSDTQYWGRGKQLRRGGRGKSRAEGNVPRRTGIPGVGMTALQRTGTGLVETEMYHRELC